ncbi:uncharacterized protein BJ171DRAFT_517658 [Polychytrium aggregatum]|uniref:uncharacterized protein n=1 Tax=Polychytrium aggregatum TaxID=110093 RepID=UPI0022FF1DE2|nr:uncharacterized protein BJ171DRAFT_517658 [Polychytrium aggregatum]KAI9199747.1 hypothetical protein BJ171DRAFT_517658 [Polychytrium aggregatum]
MSANPPSKVVFVGNIPYDLTETQLVDIFSVAGPVVSFRLVFDRESGKPKGYGFCTFRDAETAASAVRNLDKHDVGGRSLRVDFAESEKEDSDGPANRRDMDSRGGGPQLAGPPRNIPPANSAEVITRAIRSMPSHQLLDALSQVKALAQNNPDQCRTLLSQNPQLAFGIFQGLVLMNLIDPATIQSIYSGQSPAMGGPGPAPVPMAPAGIANAPPIDPYSRPMMVPPQQQPPLQPPPQPQPQPPQPAYAAAAPIPPQINPAQTLFANATPSMNLDQQTQLILQLINMPMEQVQTLSVDQQQSIAQLKQLYGGGQL